MTPLSPAEWQIKLTNGRATLHPSIGNWSMACQSHYFIRGNQVVWSGQLSKRQIKAVFERDLRDLQAMHRGTEEPRAKELGAPSPATFEHERPCTGWRARLKAFWQWLTR